MKKVLCCIPTLGNIKVELAQQLYQWKAQYGNLFDVYPSFIRPLYEARNDCVRAFLNTDASYLFFVDSDAVPPENAIEMLMSHGFDKKIVSGLCFEIKVDIDGIPKKVPMALRKVKDGYKIIDKELKGLIEVDAAGTICVIIHRSVFQNVEPPWFEGIAEDFHFYEKAKKMGFSIYVDCNCTVKHWVVMGI
jgi:hypothetical protein